MPQKTHPCGSGLRIFRPEKSPRGESDYHHLNCGGYVFQKVSTMKPVTISKSKFKTFESLSDKDAGELIKALILKEQGQTPRIKSSAVKAVIASFEKPVKEVVQGELIPIVDELESECKGFLNWVAKQMHYSAEMRDLGTNKRKQVEYCGLYRKLRQTFSKDEIKQAIQFATNDEPNEIGQKKQVIR